MTFLNNEFWLQTFGKMGLESTAIIIVVFLVQFFSHNVAWRKAIWQMGVIGVLILVFCEMSGLGQGAMMVAFGNARDEHQGTVRITLVSSVASTSEESSNVGQPIKAMEQTQTVVEKSVRWPGVIWCIGSIFVLLRMGIAHGMFLFLYFRRTGERDDLLEKRVQKIKKKLGIQQTVKCISISELSSPIVFGVNKQCVALPSDFTRNYSEPHQDAILTHELAHLAAHDPGWFLLTDIAVAFLWWNPLLWMVRRRLQLLSELAADEATALLNDGPKSLAECLVRLARDVTVQPKWAWMGVSGGFRSDLGRRVRRLLVLERQETLPRPGKGVKVMTALFLFTGIIALSGLVHGQSMQREKNWQTTFRRSLGDSVGNALWMAVITPEGKNSKLSGTPKSISIPCIVEAERLFKAGDFEKADELLAKEIVENPTNYLAGYHRILNRCRYFNQTNHHFQNITAEGTNASSHLYTKSYHVKPLVFEKALRGVLSGEDIRNEAGDLVTANIVEGWCLLLKTLGIEVVSPKPGDESDKSKTCKWAIYNPKAGVVVLRGSLNDHEFAESLIELLNLQFPQTRFDVLLVELDPTFTNNFFTSIGKNNVSDEAIGVLTKNQSDTLISNLTNQFHPKVVTYPSIVVQNEGQVMVEQTKAANLSLCLTASWHGQYSIRVSAILKQFNVGEDMKSPSQPRNVDVIDGMTIMICSARSSHSQGDKQQILFITPTLEDSAGKPLYTREEIQGFIEAKRHETPSVFPLENR